MNEQAEHAVLPHAEASARCRATRASIRSARGFSLIEAFIAIAVVGLVGVAVVNLLSMANRESRETRAANIASAEAQLIMERMIGIAAGARLHGGVSKFCEAIVATGGPLAGGTVAGTCPDMVVTNVAVANAPGTRVDATMATTTIGNTDGYRVDIVVTSPSSTPVKISTLLGRI